MDARTSALLLTCKSANELPFQIATCSSGQAVPVFFKTTGQEDSTEVHHWEKCGFSWQAGCSVFYDVWINCLVDAEGTTLKLIQSETQQKVEGLLRWEDADPCGISADAILEAAPHNQSGSKERRFKGVGTTLVVRLVLECYLRGGNALYVHTHPRNTDFYKGLRFEQSRYASGRFYLTRERAEELLTEYFFGAE